MADEQIVIPPDPSLTGAETTPAPETTTPEVPDTTPADGAADPELPEADLDGDEATTTDPEFELPDGSKIKASEIAALKSKPAAPSPAEERATELQRRVEAMEAERTAEKQAAAERAKSNQIMPDTHADAWKRARYQQYVDTYKARGLDPEQIDWRDIENDHTKALVSVMQERQRAQEQSLTQREQEADVERQRLWLDRTVGSFVGQEKYKLVDTPEGREDINAHLAVTLNQKGEIDSKDIEAAVAKVHARAHAFISNYVNKKKKTAAATAPTSRGGGQSRAPDKQKLPAEIDSIRKLGKMLGDGG